MNSSKFRLTLDLHSAQSQYSIPVMLADTSVTLLINITDGGIPYRIEDDCYASITIKRPNGTTYEDVCAVKNNSIIEYHFTKHTCVIKGIHHCDISLFDGKGERIGSPWLTMVVNETVSRRDDLEISEEDYTLLDSIAAEESKRKTAEEERVEAEAERVKAENERVKAEEARVKAEEARSERFESVEEYADRSEKAAKRVEGYGDKIIFHEKRLTNIEQGYSDDFFVTRDMGSEESITVPNNALPYAEVKKIGGKGGVTSTGRFYSQKPLKVESCKIAEKEILDATLDLSEMRETMTVEKLADGSFKFNGYTSSWGNGGACKFATFTLSAGSYAITCRNVGNMGEITLKVQSGSQEIYINENIYFDSMLNLSQDTTLIISVESDEAQGGVSNAIFFFEIQKGYWEGNEFVAESASIATLEIPEDARKLEGYGMGAKEACNYIDYDKKQFVKCVRKIVLNGTEYWMQGKTVSGALRYQLRVTPSIMRGGTNIICDQYKTVTTGNTWNDINGIAINGDLIEIKDSNCATQNAFRTRLAENPITVYYELATPEVIDIPDLLPEDNYIEVVPNGIIRVLREDGAVMLSKCEIEFRVKGV